MLLCFDLFSVNRISANWARRSVQEVGVPLPKGVQAEFKKRISAAGGAGASDGKNSKPKLNFANCDLNDDQVFY
jgi:hypothetical protein